VAEIYLVVVGRDIYVELRMPVVPGKGDYLDLNSLTGGATKNRVIVERVEWVMDQQSRIMYPRLTVRFAFPAGRL
jgi:hypothetical protein